MLHLIYITLRRGRKVRIKCASFQFHARRRTGVIGANGCDTSSPFSMLPGELEQAA